MAGISAFTVYNQSGGQAKTSISRDLAATFAEAGKDVLAIDLDSQNGSLSNYFGRDRDKADPDADDLTLHMIRKGRGPVRELIESAEPGVDVIPSHKRMSNITGYLDTAAEYEAADKPDDWEYQPHEQLLRVIKEASLMDDYDVLICDTNAKAGQLYYMSLYTTRAVLVPAIPTRSGYESIQGVADTAKAFAEGVDIGIQMLGVVPTMVDARKNGHEEWAKRLQESYEAPVYFKALSAFEKAEANHESVFSHFADRDRIRSSEADILPKYRVLASSVADNLESSLPPGTWDDDELFSGDEFWGNVTTPSSASDEGESTNPTVN